MIACTLKRTPEGEELSVQSPSAGNGNRHAARHIAEKSRTLPILAPVWSVSQLDGQGVGIVSGRQSGASRCLSIDIDGSAVPLLALVKNAVPLVILLLWPASVYMS